MTDMHRVAGQQNTEGQTRNQRKANRQMRDSRQVDGWRDLPHPVTDTRTGRVVLRSTTKTLQLGIAALTTDSNVYINWSGVAFQVPQS